MSLFTLLPADLRREILLYFSYYYITHHDIISSMSMSPIDDTLWKLYFERDFGSAHIFRHVDSYQLEYKSVYEKNAAERLSYAYQHGIAKLKVDTEFLKAAKSQNTYRVQQLIERGYPECSRCEMPSECINNVECRKADINACNNNNNTALLYFSHANSLVMVKYLVEKGAEINAQNLLGETPLFRATWNGNMEMVRYLVEHGADANLRHTYGYGPLHWAIDRNNREMITFLSKITSASYHQDNGK